MRIAYVCEGGGRLGWGHVGRARAVAEASDGRVVISLGRGFDEIARWCDEHGVALPLVSWRHDDRPFDAAEVDYDAVIVDHYTLRPDWLAAVGERAPVVVIDDWMRSGAPVAAMVNPNIGAHRSDYATGPQEWLLGPDFALIRREVREARSLISSTGTAERLLVTLGGSDPDGRTAQVAEALVETSWYQAGGRLTIVLGPSYAGDEPWRRWPESLQKTLEVVRQPRDYVERVVGSDVVICGASTTTYELALLGRPFSPVALVDNQARVSAGWAASGVGAGVCVWEPNWRSRLVEDVTRLLAPGHRRSQLSTRLRSVVDGRGAARLLETCDRLSAVRSIR